MDALRPIYFRRRHPAPWEPPGPTVERLHCDVQSNVVLRLVPDGRGGFERHTVAVETIWAPNRDEAVRFALEQYPDCGRLLACDGHHCPVGGRLVHVAPV